MIRFKMNHGDRYGIRFSTEQTPTLKVDTPISYGDRYNLYLLVKPKLPDAKEEFEEYAEEWGLPSAIEAEANNVRFANAFDYLVKSITELTKKFADDHDATTVSELKSETEKVLRRLIESAISDQTVKHSKNQPSREARAEAIKALRKVLHSLSVLENK